MSSTHTMAPSGRWKNAGVWMLVNGLGRGVGLARSILVARFLSPEVASLGYLSLSVGLGARATLETGSRNVVVTSKTASPRLVSAAWQLELGKALLLAAALCVGAWSAQALGAVDFDAEVLLLAALLPLTIGTVNPISYLWEREGNHSKVARITALGTLCGLGAVAALFSLGVGWYAIPVGFAIGQVVTTTLSHVMGRGLERSLASPRDVGRLLVKGAPFLVIGLATYAKNFGVDLALAVFGGLKWVAVYRLSTSLVQTVLSTVPIVLARASLSHDAASARDDSTTGVAPADFRTFTVVAFATSTLGAASYLLLPDLAVWVYGDAWEATRTFIPPLCVTYGILGLSSPMGVVLTASRKYWTEATVRLGECVVMAVLIGALAPLGVTVGIWASALWVSLAFVVRVRALRTLGAKHSGRSSIVLVGALFCSALVVHGATLLVARFDASLMARFVLGAVASALAGGGVLLLALLISPSRSAD